jgi:hypothetical protein
MVSQFKSVRGSITPIDSVESRDLLPCFSLKSRTDYLLISKGRGKHHYMIKEMITHADS